MRKMSAYARRMRRGGEAAQHYQGAAWLNAIQRCKAYSEPIPEWTGLANTATAATESQLVIRAALDDLLHHRVEPEDATSYNLLAHAVDVSHIRALQVKADPSNPMNAPLLAAKAALNQVSERRQRTGRWGLAGPERAVLAKAIELYEEIITNSSPEQMHKAATIRYDGIRRGKLWSAPAP